MKFDLIIHKGEITEYLPLLAERVGVYLIHFDKKLEHAQHYVGFSTNLAERLDIHHKGNADSCKLLLAVKDSNIKWRLAHVWVGEDHNFERDLKRSAQVARLCPFCRPGRLTYARDYMVYRRTEKKKEPVNR